MCAHACAGGAGGRLACVWGGACVCGRGGGGVCMCVRGAGGGACVHEGDGGSRCDRGFKCGSKPWSPPRRLAGRQAGSAIPEAGTQLLPLLQLLLPACLPACRSQIHTGSPARSQLTLSR